MHRRRERERERAGERGRRARALLLTHSLSPTLSLSSLTPSFSWWSSARDGRKKLGRAVQAKQQPCCWGTREYTGQRVGDMIEEETVGRRVRARRRGFRFPKLIHLLI